MEKFVETQLVLLALEREEELASSGVSLLSTGIKNQKELEAKGACISKLQVESSRIGLYGRKIVALEPARRLGVQKLPANCIKPGKVNDLWIAQSRKCCKASVRNKTCKIID